MARTPQNRRVAEKRGRQGEGGGRRPIVWGQREVDKITTLIGYGMKRAHIAVLMDVDEDTLTEIEGRQPEVARALKTGLYLAASQVSQTLYQRAIGFTVMRPKLGLDGKPMKDEDGNTVEERVYIREPDLGAIVWWEKTRMGYADPRQLRHADSEGNPLPERPAVVKVYHMPDNGRQEAVPAFDAEAERARAAKYPNGANGKRNGRG